jgi:hypothetical protein
MRNLKIRAREAEHAGTKANYALLTKTRNS